MTDTVHIERRRGLLYQLVIAIAATILVVVVLLGIAWLQFQVATLSTAFAQRGERIIVSETQIKLLQAEIAELRIRQLELDRALGRLRAASK